jgi:hypothetical protein
MSVILSFVCTTLRTPSWNATSGCEPPATPSGVFPLCSHHSKGKHFGHDMVSQVTVTWTETGRRCDSGLSVMTWCAASGVAVSPCRTRIRGCGHRVAPVHQVPPRRTTPPARATGPGSWAGLGSHPPGHVVAPHACQRPAPCPRRELLTIKGPHDWGLSSRATVSAAVWHHSGSRLRTARGADVDSSGTQYELVQKRRGVMRLAGLTPSGATTHAARHVDRGTTQVQDEHRLTAPAAGHRWT